MIPSVKMQPIGYARFKLLLDKNGAPYDAMFLEINPGFETYFGKNLRQLKGITKFKLFEDFYKDDKQAWLKEYYKVAFEGQDFIKVVNFESKNVSFEMSVHCPKEGEFIALFQSFSNHEYNDEACLNILSNMSDTIFVTDLEGEFKFICPSVASIFGYSVEEVKLQSNIQSLIGKAYKNQLHQALMYNVNDQPVELVKDFEQSILDKSGNVHHLLIDIKRINIMGGDLLFVCKDVSQLHKSMKAAKNEQVKLKTIIDTIPDLVWLKDSEGRFLACNKEFERLFGKPEKEILGKTDYDFVDTEIADSFRKHDLKAMKSKKVARNEERVIYKSDGSVRDVETTKTVIYDTDHQIVGVLGTARDISERKKNESRFKEIIRQAPYGIALIDDHGTPYMVNNSLCKMLGYNAREIMKMKVKDFTHPDDFLQDYENYQKLLKQEIQSYTVEKRYINKNGGILHANLVVCLIDDPYSNSGKRALAMVQDLTEKVKVEQDYETLIQTAADPIYLVDHEGVILKANDSSLRMTGYLKEELTGSFMGLLNKRFSDIQTFTQFTSRFDAGESYMYRTEHTTKDGERIPLEMNIRVTEIDCKRKYFAVARDIRIRDKQEKELVEKNELLAVAQQTAKLGSWSFNISSEKMEWSDEVYRIFDMTSKDVSPSKNVFFKLAHPEEHQSVKNYFDQCASERKAYDITYRIITEKGEVRYVESNAKFVFDKNSSELIAQGTIRDITKEVKHRNALNRQIRRLQMVLSTGKLTAFEVDLETNDIRIFRDKSEIRRNGFPVEKLEDFETFISAIKGHHRKYFLKKIEKIKSSAIENFTYEFQFKLENRFAWFESSVTLLKSEQGAGRRVFVVIKNVEEQKNRELAELVGQEKERLRVSRDIHDSIGQMLVGTRLMLKVDKIGQEEGTDVQSIDEMLDSMIKESRIIINNFGISLLDNSSTKEAFENLAAKMKRVYLGSISVNWEGSPFIINLKVATNIFRIFQEALSNSIKYSQSKEIKVIVKNYDMLVMEVWDNGVGFNLANTMAGFGIDNMHERAKQIGATLKIVSSKTSGTGVILWYSY